MRKLLFKLGAPVLALSLITACGTGDDQEPAGNEAPLNQEDDNNNNNPMENDNNNGGTDNGGLGNDNNGNNGDGGLMDENNDSTGGTNGNGNTEPNDNLNDKNK